MSVYFFIWGGDKNDHDFDKNDSFGYKLIALLLFPKTRLSPFFKILESP